METEQISNYELVTIAVMLVGGDQDYADTEDVAIKADELAPGRFGWRKYSDRIDLDSVRVALRDAKKPKNGGLLIGNNVDGWMLSPAGLRWSQLLDLEQTQTQQPIRYRRDSIAANLESERVRLRHSKAYELFLQGRNDVVSKQDFYEFARINEYFGEKARQRRFVMVSNAVAGDRELSDLWTTLKVRFQKEMLSDVSSQTD
jgi:hypothetical protein